MALCAIGFMSSCVDPGYAHYPQRGYQPRIQIPVPAAVSLRYSHQTQQRYPSYRGYPTRINQSPYYRLQARYSQRQQTIRPVGPPMQTSVYGRRLTNGMVYRP